METTFLCLPSVFVATREPKPQENPNRIRTSSLLPTGRESCLKVWTTGAFSGFGHGHKRPCPKPEEAPVAHVFKACLKDRGLWSQERLVPPWQYRGRQPGEAGGEAPAAGTVLIIVVVLVLFPISLAGG